MASLCAGLPVIKTLVISNQTHRPDFWGQPLLPTLTPASHPTEIWDSLLQCCKCCTWTHLEQQNTEKLYGTKNNFMHGQLQTNSGQKMQKKQTNRKRNCYFSGAWAKAGWTVHAPPLTPGHTPTLTQYNEQAYHLPASQFGEPATKGNLFVLAPPCWAWVSPSFC